jgi:hypothetical protein
MNTPKNEQANQCSGDGAKHNEQKNKRDGHVISTVTPPVASRQNQHAQDKVSATSVNA